MDGIKHNHTMHVHDSAKQSGKKMFWATILNASITIVEIVEGSISGSLALISDSIHNLSDTIAISAILILESIKRFITPQPIKGTLMIIVASIGLLANFISIYLLEKDSRKNLNINQVICI